MLDHERARLRPGLLLLGDKGFAGRDFEELVAAPERGCCGLTAAMSRTGMARWPLAPVDREHLQHLKDQLGLERHRGRTLAGVDVRVAQRLLALAAAIWWNWQLAAPDKRSLVAYDH
jgi:hypothetical protein